MTDRKLAKILDEHRDALMAIDGVIGIGLGLFADEPVIQIFVSPSSDREVIRQGVDTLVAGAPVELISMTTPSAQGTA
ncbi:MAG: hypothetical protein GY791_03390 [Alphaproteobacteria bacterium]|nr:hypothetical protein [Alphaproteobacteria bacterium]